MRARGSSRGSADVAEATSHHRLEPWRSAVGGRGPFRDTAEPSLQRRAGLLATLPAIHHQVILAILVGELAEKVIAAACRSAVHSCTPRPIGTIPPAPHPRPGAPCPPGRGSAERRQRDWWIVTSASRPGFRGPFGPGVVMTRSRVGSDTARRCSSDARRCLGRALPRGLIVAVVHTGTRTARARAIGGRPRPRCVHGPRTATSTGPSAAAAAGIPHSTSTAGAADSRRLPAVTPGVRVDLARHGAGFVSLGLGGANYWIRRVLHRARRSGFRHW